MLTPTRRRTRTTLLGAALAAAAASTALATGPTAAAGGDDDGPNTDALLGVTDVATRLKPGETIAAVNATYDTRVRDALAPARSTYLVVSTVGESPVALAERMEDDPRLEWVEPNYADGQPEGNPTYRWSGGEPRAAGTDPAVWRRQPALTQVRAAAAHVRSRGQGTTVAVVDTGIRLQQPYLRDRIAPGGYDFVTGDPSPQEGANGRDDDGDGDVDEGAWHGTHVAGIVAVAAPGARLLPLRVLDDEGRGYVWDAAEAIEYAVEREVDVINLSLGTVADSELLEDAVEEAEDDDVVVVAAAGNDASSVRQYPAAGEDVLAVASVTPADGRSPFTNAGPWVDVAAPGQRIASTYGASSFARWDGTSMATPLVAGQAALIMSRFPDIEDDGVLRRIRSTADPVGGWIATGRVDLAASLG